jgi:DNA-binding NtrC family response regulator
MGTCGIAAGARKTMSALLAAIESRKITRVGTNQPRAIDVRVICATNQNIEKAVEEGQFREDLYYRLNVFSIFLPPLRERRQDIPALAQHFLRKYALQMNKNFAEINPEAMDLLVRHEWPGNIRELGNAIERALVVGRPPAVRPGDLPLQISSRSDSIPADSLATTIATALTAGHAITMGSYASPPAPVVGSQAYMIKSIEGSGSSAYVTVYNPWGIDGRSYDSNPNDGLLRLTVAQVQGCFSAVVEALV